MTAQLVDAPRFGLCSTVSAEELTRWPDEIGVSARRYKIRTPQGTEESFINYSANVERTRLDIEEDLDTVIACEIVEHFIRSPHVIFLNINRNSSAPLEIVLAKNREICDSMADECAETSAWMARADTEYATSSCLL